MSKFRIIGAIVGLFVLGLVLLGARPDADTVAVSSRVLTHTAEIRGSLLAEDSLKFGPPARVQSQWNFKIAFMAPEGSDIDPGAPLLAFDTTDLQLRLLEALSSLERAEANLEKRLTSSDLEQEDRDLALAEARAEASRARLKVEAPTEVVASKELEQARIDLETAEKKHQHLTRKTTTQAQQAASQVTNLRNQVQRARALVQRLESEIASMSIAAPSGGTVVYESNWRGEKKKVGDETHRMQKVISLPNLDKLRATARIDEIYAAEVEMGQRVTFALDAFPEELFDGVIRGINPAVQQRSRRDPRKAVTVDIELTNPDPERMRPGMRIEGELEILRTDPVPAIPASAVVWVDGKPAVWLQGWFGKRLEFPTLGRHSEEFVEVIDGLTLKQRVVVAPELIGDAG